MKIVADENIPQVKEAFKNFGEVFLISGREISNDILKDADILLTRSITNVNEELLENTNIKFVATATIGIDHIDLDYLKYRNIEFADAKGCNAYSVAEYVVCSIANIFYNKNILLDNKKIGVVGYGNIGTKISNFAETIGLSVLINDPPLERISAFKIFNHLENTLKSNIITFHVPLNKSGLDKTYHLIDDEKINLIKENTLLINTSRGPVVDNAVLKNRLEKQNDITTVLDVWENEPNVDIDLLSKVNIGTAHIAGYSLEGKLNGTLLIYEKFCDCFGFKPVWQPNYPSLENNLIAVNTNDPLEKILNDTLSKVYNVENDSTILKECSKLNNELRGKCFDNIRKTYSVRREFNNYTIKLNKRDNKLKEIFEALRFKVT